MSKLQVKRQRALRKACKVIHVSSYVSELDMPGYYVYYHNDPNQEYIYGPFGKRYAINLAYTLSLKSK